MTVYVITIGDYSDYHICNVTLNEERAELLRRFYTTGTYEACVEVYDVDDNEPSSEVLSKMKPVFCIGILRNGSILDRGKEPNHYMIEPYENKFMFNNFPEDDTFWGYVVSDDYEHAKKITCDMRARRLAERFGL